MGERRTAVIIGTTVVIFVGILLSWAFISGDQRTPPKLVEITDSSAIQSQARVSRVGIATGTSYFGQKVRVINGTLQNTSDKPLRRIEMKMVFVDYDEKSIQETVERVYDVKQKPLDPGKLYRFETRFENLPANWNHRIPNVEIVKIAY
jgi:hypothetical protein